MGKFFNLVLTILAVLVLAIMVLGFIRTFMVNRSDEQDVFMAGTMPAPLPDGFYAGQAEPFQGGWKGKKFDRAKNIGINVFGTRSGDDRLLYPFKTWQGKGLRDEEKDVLKIDYDLDENPFWLRPVLDEVVQVEPGVLLGKLHYRGIPGFPLTVTFFRLEMGIIF